jgi:F-type H+-transporting ATPase subunit b
MKIPGIRRNRCRASKARLLLFAMALMGLLLIGQVALAAGGGDGAVKHWEATDTYRVMNFAVLAIALFFLLKKPVAQALNSRIQGIEEQLSDLEAKKAAAEKELASYNDQLAKLEKEAESMMAEYVQQGNEAKERILKEAEASAAKLEEQAKRTIESEFKQARQQLQDEVMATAMEKAEAMIQASITDDDQNRLVDDYLEKVVA